MGLKVQGFGATRATMTDALKPIEQELEIISKTPLEAGNVPDGKKALRARADVLDKQIEILSKHLESSDPKVRDSAATLLDVAKRERLRLEDPLLTWVVDDLSRSKKSVTGPTLAAPEVAAVTALLGGLVTDAEVHHAIETLAPLAGQNLTDVYFQPKVDSTDAHFDTLRKKTSPAALKVAGLRVGPAMGGFFATSAVRAFGAPASLAFFTAALALRIGFQSGKYLAGQETDRVKFEKGNNRLEGEVDHDLVRVAERAKSGAPFADRTGADLTRSAQDEGSLVGYLAARRKETWTDKPASYSEKQAVAAMETYAKALGSATDASSISAARTAFGAATKAYDLGSIPSLIELVPQAVDSARVNAAFDEMMAEYGRMMVGTTNTPLLAMVKHLSAKQGAPDAGELAYLKVLVGKDASVGEILALSPLFSGNKVDPKALWPEGTTMTEGGLDQTKVSTLIDGLGSRDEGERTKWWGKVAHAAAPVLGALIGAGFMAFAPLTGLMSIGGAFAGTLLGEKVGHKVGDYLTNKGTSDRLLEGVEMTPALGPEYVLGLSTIMRGAKDATSGSAAQVAGKLKDEAGTLEALVASVGRNQIALAARGAQLVDGPEKEAIDQALTLHKDLRAPMYETLAGAAAALREAAGSGDLAAMRAGYAETRANLLQLMPSMILDVLVSQASPELSLKHGVYFRVKRELAEAILANEKPEVILPLANRLADTYSSIPKKQRPDDDALDKYAKETKKDASADRSAANKLVTPLYLGKIEKQRIETLSIKDARAKEIGQEVMNALWGQVYARFGLHSEEEVPQLTGIAVTRTPMEGEAGFENLKLTGKVKGGGKFEMNIDALGLPSTDLSALHIDLGEKILGNIVKSAAERHIGAATGSEPSIGKIKLMERNDDGYVFAVPVGGKTLKATISPEGLVSPAFLTA